MSRALLILLAAWAAIGNTDGHGAVCTCVRGKAQTLFYTWAMHISPEPNGLNNGCGADLNGSLVWRPNDSTMVLGNIIVKLQQGTIRHSSQTSQGCMDPENGP